MPKIALMTDSVAGINEELAEKHQIKTVPTAYIIYDGHSYLEGESINAVEAYQLLRRDPDKFNTSAISPDYLINVYRELSKKSQEILFITVSSALSAVSKSALLAAKLFREQYPEITIHVIDSKTVAGGEGLMVLAAAKAVARGMSLEQVVNMTGQLRQKTGTFILIDTLRYVYRTGRIPKFASMLGSALGVKPLSRVSDDGALHPAGVSRTRKGGISRMLELIKEDAGTDSLHFMIMHADDPPAAEELSEQLKGEFNALSMTITEFSPVMGYGSGPGTLAVGFHPEIDFPK